MTNTQQQQARDWAYQHTVDLEKVEKVIYNDGQNIPTIGVGYAAVVMGGKGWAVKETLEQDFQSVGAPLSADAIRTLDAIARAKNAGDEAKAASLIESLSDVAINLKQARSLYDLSFDHHYALAKSYIHASVFDRLDAKHQGVLTIAAYQSPKRLREVSPAIRAGIEEKNPSKVMGALKQMGKKLGEAERYHGLARAYFDPDMTHSVNVNSGDSLSAIAKRNGTTVNALAKVNPHIDNLNKIRSGDILALPAGAKVNGQFVYDAASAHKKLGVNLSLDSASYIGASHEFSPEDTLTPSQNRAQLALNAKALEARRASLLDGGAARAVRATLPEQFSLPDFSNLFNNAVDGLQSVLGVKAAAAKGVAPARGQLESAKVAGLVMDQPMADKVMTSKAYQTKTDPLNGFATTAACRFEYAPAS